MLNMILKQNNFVLVSNPNIQWVQSVVNCIIIT